LLLFQKRMELQELVTDTGGDEEIVPQAVTVAGCSLWCIGNGWEAQGRERTPVNVISIIGENLEAGGGSTKDRKAEFAGWRRCREGRVTRMRPDPPHLNLGRFHGARGNDLDAMELQIHAYLNQHPLPHPYPSPRWQETERELSDLQKEIFARSSPLPWPPSWRMTGGSYGEEARGHHRRRAAARSKTDPRSNRRLVTHAFQPPPLDFTASQAVARLQVGPNKRHVSINERGAKARELRALGRCV
jgi:hypothetical protein